MQREAGCASASDPYAWSLYLVWVKCIHLGAEFTVTVQMSLSRPILGRLWRARISRLEALTDSGCKLLSDGLVMRICLEALKRADDGRAIRFCEKGFFRRISQMFNDLTGHRPHVEARR